MSTTTDLPILFQKASTGAMKCWMIRVRAYGDGTAEIITTHGQVGGAKQTDRQTITEGKNIGKANETTPAEQALAQATSKWDRKVKKGYVTDYDAAEAGEVDTAVIAGGIDPMLAHVYAKQGHKITYPALAQPKLDGHRCIAVVNDDGSVSLWSRTRKAITGVPHIARAIEALGLNPSTVLDGELYHHDYRDNFEDLTSFIRQATPKDGHEVVQYHVYDLPSYDAPTHKRLESLAAHVGFAGGPLVLVETIEVANEEALLEAFAEWMADGYEGAMVRNAESLYANKRSYDLQKVKEFDDAEFEIVDVNEGVGRMAGRAVFVCRTDAGETFSVKMKGSLDALREFVEHPDRAIGRILTVQYQGMTTAGVPRFPVGLRFREDA